MKKSVLIGMLIASNSYAFNSSFQGWLESFSKIGFNNQSINEDLGKYPTESFASMVGSVGLFGDILESKRLSYGLSVTAGGLVLDSSMPKSPGAVGSINTEYIGSWRGYNSSKAESIRTFVFNNAFLKYNIVNNEKFSLAFKGGRYKSIAEYMSGYTQGFELESKIALNSNGSNLKLWWFSSYGRAFAYGEWLIDFYSPRGYFTDSGRFANYGIHAFKAEFNVNLNEKNKLLILPYVYFSPGTYTAPAFRLAYAFIGNKLYSKTMINLLSPIHDDRVVGQYYYGNLAGKNTFNLYATQTFIIKNVDFGVGIYKNFGNANARIGTNGNYLMLDFWTASAYDLGRSISDMIGKDAITPFLFVGANHGKKGQFNWKLIGRITESSRSSEQSVALNANYSFNNVTIGAKLEYFNDITKANYKVGANGNTQGVPKNISDRSHAFLYINYKFDEKLF